MIQKIISGGQTGVDRAALDFAIKQGICCGGWCPKGRKAEDGILADHYPLQETPSPEYEQRTRWNVRDSTGTFVLTFGPPTRGTALTIALAKRLGRPCLVMDGYQRLRKQDFFEWITTHHIRILNIAGPRDSPDGEIYRKALSLLNSLFYQRFHQAFE